MVHHFIIPPLVSKALNLFKLHSITMNLRDDNSTAAPDCSVQQGCVIKYLGATLDPKTYIILALAVGLIIGFLLIQQKIVPASVVPV